MFAALLCTDHVVLSVSQTNMEDLSKKSGKLYLVDLAGV